jgi:hypothetical protein
LELLTAELSASFVASDKKVDAEVTSAKVALEDSHASTLLDQANYFGIKHAKELANAFDAYEVKLVGELERAEDKFTRKACIAESIFQKMLDEEKNASDKYYLDYTQCKDMWQTLKAKMELPPQGGVVCVLADHEGAPPSGIEVVNVVEDFAQDEVEREGEQPLEVVPSTNVIGTNHPNVALSHDDELAQVKRQCDNSRRQ